MTNLTPKKNKPYKGSLTDKVDLLLGSQTSSQTSSKVLLEKITLPEFQPRQHFDDEQLTELAESISKHGILEPLLLRSLSDDRYELVAGGRRYRAAKRLNLIEVPAVILQLSDEEAFEIAIVENLQREDLNPIEETEGILKLLETRLTYSQEEIISLLYRMRNDKMGQTRRNVSPNSLVEVETVEKVFAPLGITWKSFVETRLPLLKLPQELIDALRLNKITYTKAKAISKLNDSVQRKALLKESIEKGLSLTQIRQRIKEMFQVELNNQEPSPPLVLADTYNRLKRSHFWKDPRKWKKAQTLLRKLEALISEENQTNSESKSDSSP